MADSTMVVDSVDADNILDGKKYTNFKTRVFAVLRGLKTLQVKGEFTADDAARIAPHRKNSKRTRLQEFADAVDYIEAVEPNMVPNTFRIPGVEYRDLRKAAITAFSGIERYKPVNQNAAKDNRQAEREMAELAEGLDLSSWITE